MLTGIGLTGIQSLGDKYRYVEGCLHQPVRFVTGGLGSGVSIPIVQTYTLANSYNLCPTNLEADNLFADNSVFRNAIEKTRLYIYTLQRGVSYQPDHAHPVTHGDIGRFVYSDSNPLDIGFKPPITITSAGGASVYSYRLFAEWDSKFNFYRIVNAGNFTGLPTKPNYIHFLNGYYLDNRTVLPQVEILPTETKTINLEYYQWNKLEPVPNLRSIDYSYYQVDLIKDKLCKLPISDCVMGTLYCDDSNVIDLISNIAKPDKYEGRYFFEANLPQLFGDWNNLYTTALNAPLASPVVSFTPIATEYEYQVETERNLRVLGANNNYWNNRDTPTVDLIPNFAHPTFTIDDERAYNWHIKPQSDDSFGDLIMNSPLLINIGKALDVAKWSVNLDDPDLPRVDNLGWRIARTNEVLGIRVKPNGEIDPDKDKKLVRQVIDKDKRLQPKDIGILSFGKLGMVVKRITNRFKRKGKDNEIVSDQCVIVQDIPQLMQEYFDQINLALGIQESSAIEIKQGAKGEDKAIFNSQLEILIDMFSLMCSSNEMTRAALVSSLVTQSQTSELIAGLGLPSVTKTIPIEIDNKVSQIPFKGIAAHRSISQEIATCTYNVGLVTGQLL